MLGLEAAPVDPARLAIEVVERKGRGHPDTLCDSAAEAFSRRLSRAYLEAEGRILHHNVDKALLVAGSTQVGFGGGRWLHPIRVVLGGRATGTAREVEEIGREAVAEAMRAVRHLDPARVETEVAVRPGSADLREVFEHGGPAVPLANDTSIGVGLWPPSATERLALAVDERLLRSAATRPDSPLGEDTKVMVVRSGRAVRVTVAVAMVASRVPDEAAYRAAVAEVRDLAADEARQLGFPDVEVLVNAADAATGSFYLTLSGTSAECGDDGQVGRGNRLSGLITPMRPMTLEAHAGKNPCTHVGKLLSLAAARVAASCARLEGVRSAECLLVSRIGAPVSEPQAACVRLDGPPDRVAELRDTVAGLVADACREMPALWRELVGAAPESPVAPG